MRIGKRDRAIEAHGLSEYGQRDNGVLRRLSGGGCRDVYMDVTSGVVYKVQTCFDSYMRGFGNRTEYTHARALRASSDNGWHGRVYIPATSAYSVDKSLVIAMEHIDGEEPSWHNDEATTKAHQEALRQLFFLGFGDMHRGNYMWMPGRRVAVAPVDMGSMRYTKDPLSNADQRVVNGTAFSKQVTDHRDFRWRNIDRQPNLPPSCPCGCGLVRWTT